jgi:alanyl-tRNA synthetase
MRFDFSHYAKVSEEEIAAVEKLVNQKIRQNIPVITKILPKEEAMAMGAMALFGEKYGDRVRVVIIDPNYSVELCGGTHVASTGELGIFKIISEGAIAAGVRRIEALAGCKAEAYINEQMQLLQTIKNQFKNPKDLVKTIETLSEEKTKLQKQLDRLEARALVGIRNDLLQKVETIKNISFIGEQVEVSNPDALRKLCMDLKNELTNYVVVLTTNIDGKPFVALLLDETLAKQNNWLAPNWIKEYIAPKIKGGGGGQAYFATAGGQDSSNLQQIPEWIKGVL